MTIVACTYRIGELRRALFDRLDDGEPALFACTADEIVRELDAIDDEPLVPIFPHAKVRGYPPAATPFPYRPLSYALTEPFDRDAHSAAYFDPTRPHRLNYEALPERPVTLVTMQLDIDCPKEHRDASGGAPEWWLAVTQAGVEALDAAQPGGFWNVTRKGVHGVYVLAPRTIANREDADAFRRWYLACLAYLERVFGLAFDPAMATWNQLFRLPHARRDGVDQQRPSFGDPCNVGQWTYEPTVEDYAAEKNPRPKRRGVPLAPPDPNTPDPLIARAAAVGLLGAELSPGKYVALCPNRRHHTSDTDGTSSTVLWRGRGFHCSHAHCTDIGRRDFVRAVDCREGIATTLDGVESVVCEAMAAPGPMLIVVPPGAGKSRAARRYLASAEGTRAILTDTHVLAAQTRRLLRQEHGVEAEHHGGVLATIEGREGCAYPERVGQIQAAGLSVGRYACAKCPKRSTCPAREPAGEGDIRIGVHAMAGAEALRVGRAILDEEPIALSERIEITAETIAAAVDGLDHCSDKEYLHLIAPWLRMWKLVSDRTAADLATAAALVMTPGARAQLLEWAQTKYDRKAKVRLMEWRVDPDLPPYDLARACADLTDREPAIHTPEGRATWEVAPRTLAPVRIPAPWFESADDATIAKWARRARALKDIRHTAQLGAVIRGNVARVQSESLRSFMDGGVLLSATPTMEILRTVAPDLRVVRLLVPDGTSITRILVKVSDACTGKLDCDPERVARLVKDALERARVFGATRVLLVVAKALHEAARVAGEGAGAGMEVDVRTYGSLRGLDDWMSCDSFVTIGENFADKIANAEEADFFGVERARLWTSRVAAEIAQAHGRARDPSRKTAALHLHYGSVWPAGWSHETTDVTDGPKGRPKTAATMTVEELRAKVDAVGGTRAAARGWKIDERTLRRYLRGDRAVPDDIAKRTAKKPKRQRK